MSRFYHYLNSSIMKKQIMGVTGLLLCGFLVSHLIGNGLIYFGDRAFNTYAHTLVTNPLIYFAEAILLGIFVTHIFLAMKLTLENKAARPVAYAVKKPTGRGSTFASSTMPYTGLLILVFLVFHILHFKFGPVYKITYDGVEMRDLYRLLVEYFHQPLAVVWYVFCMLALGLHVSHGFWSAFQSIGFNHPKYNSCLKNLAKVYALLMTVGFSALPIYCYLQGGR